MIRPGPPDRMPAAAPGPSAPLASRGEVDEAGAERFGDLLRPVGERGEGGARDETARPDEDDAGADADAVPSPRDETWRSFGDPVRFAPEPVAEAAPAEAPRTAATLVEELAERLLVGMREDGSAELRITLKDTALAGSELRIARAEGGVQVQVLAAGEGAAVLERHGGELAALLAERLGTRVVVAMLPAPGTASGAGEPYGDAGARGAAGDGGGERHEGRSRGLAALFEPGRRADDARAARAR